MENYKLCAERVIASSEFYLTCLASYEYITSECKNIQEYIAENTKLSEAVEKYTQSFNVLAKEYNSRRTTLSVPQGRKVSFAY